MSISASIIKAFVDKKKRGWSKIYIGVDIHGTILKSNYEVGNPPKEFFPKALETLQYISQMPNIVMFLYTCSHPHEIEEYLKLFEENGIKFQYINENPEVETDNAGYGCYDKKPYFNVLLDDKAGFNPLVDWEEILVDIIAWHNY